MTSDNETILINDIIPYVVKSGRFGNNATFLRCEKDKDNKTGVQYCSTVLFTTAVIKESGGSEKERRYHLVAKFQPDSIYVQQLMNTEVQFHNENIMYSEVLPLLNHKKMYIDDLFPKFYFGGVFNGGNYGKPIILIENLKPNNYQLANSKLFLDKEHIVLVLKELGKFHASSYVAKQTDSERFYEIVNKLKDHFFDKDQTLLDQSLNLLMTSVLRGFDAFCDFKQIEALKKVSKNNNITKLMKFLLNHDETTSVICHGDFCNHNMFFKYENGVPVAVKFFDLQTSRYASPVIDLSMILYLNTSYDLRSNHWLEFIKVYHDSVTEHVLAADCIPPTYEQLIAEFKNKSIYGYVHCSYFLPMMLSETPMNMDDSANLSCEELTKLIVLIGGDKGTQSIVDILRTFEKHNYFGFIDFFED